MVVVSHTVIEVRMQKGQLLKRDRNSVLQQTYQMILLPYRDHLTVPATLINLARGKYYYTVLCILIILQLHNYCYSRKTATSSQSVSKKVKRVEQPEISDDDEDFERPRR